MVANEPDTRMHAGARAIIMAFVSTKHVYEGDCPDLDQPDARDPECEACQWLMDLTVAPSDPASIRDLLAPPYHKGFVSGVDSVLDAVDEEDHRLGVYSALREVLSERGLV